MWVRGLRSASFLFSILLSYYRYWYYSKSCSFDETIMLCLWFLISVKKLKTRIIYLFWAHIGSSVHQHIFSSARFSVRHSSNIWSKYILKLSLNNYTLRWFIQPYPITSSHQEYTETDWDKLQWTYLGWPEYIQYLYCFYINTTHKKHNLVYKRECALKSKSL